MYHLIYVVKPKKMSRVSCLASAQGNVVADPFFVQETYPSCIMRIKKKKGKKP